MSMIDDPGPKLGGSGFNAPSLQASAFGGAAGSYVFRHIDLTQSGVAVGLNDSAMPQRVVIPTVVGGRQFNQVTIGVEEEDTAWSAGVFTLYEAGAENATPLSLATTITQAGNKTVTITGVDFPWLVVKITTVNVAAAYVTLTITPSEGT